MDRQTVGVGLGGAALVGVAFGMARYAYGLTLPAVRSDFELSELLLALIASGTFAGYLVGLVAVPQLSARRGSRAPTTVGGLCGTVGAATVALAPSPWLLAAGVVLTGSAAGWVWAPYNDIVTRVAPRRHQPTVLAAITTGTSVGLVGLATLAMVANLSSWRVIWAGIAAAAALAALVNLRSVPRVEAEGIEAWSRGRTLWRREMSPPIAFALVYFATTTVYLTYATDAARAGELSTSATPLLFGLVGAGGLIGLATGRMTAALGTMPVGIGSIAVVSAALVVLAVGRESMLVALASAFLLGAGFMVGSSLLAIWTAQVAPDRPLVAFTRTLEVGAVASIAAPALMGALIPAFGLPQMLAVVAVAGVLGAAALVLVPPRETPLRER